MTMARRWLMVGALGVLVWRLLAIRWPHAMSTDPPAVRNVLAVLGLWYLSCGLWVMVRNWGDGFRSKRVVWLYVAWALATALHWGGPLGFGSPRWDAGLLGLYVVLSTVAAQVLFLHLALAHPTPLGDRLLGRLGLVVLYLPFLVGLVASIALPFMFTPGESFGGPGAAVPEKVLMALFLVAEVFGVVAGIIWLYRAIKVAIRVQHDEGGSFRDPFHLRAVALALLAGFLPHAVASALGPVTAGYDGLFNLTLLAFPVALAASVMSPVD